MILHAFLDHSEPIVVILQNRSTVSLKKIKKKTLKGLNPISAYFADGANPLKTEIFAVSPNQFLVENSQGIQPF